MSWRRLDQLGLSVEEVRAKYDELREANASMSEQAAFSQAVLDTAEQKFGELARGADMAASGFERMRSEWKDLVADIGKNVESSTQGPTNWIANQMDNAQRERQLYQISKNLGSINSDRNLVRNQIGATELSASRNSEDRMLSAGLQARAELFRRELAQLNQEWVAAQVEASKLNPELTAQAEAMGALTDAINPATQSLAEMNAAAAESGGGEALKQVMEDAAAMADAIGKAVDSAGRASESRVYAITGNADEAVAAYESITASLWDFVRAQQAAGKSDETILNLLDAEAKRVGEISGLYDVAVDGATRLTTANTILAQSLGSAATAMAIYSQNLSAMGTTALNVAGAIASA
ncbi:MAG: hypothetical protein KDE20_27290, partial [Caldilineaceae bacterium]|nr:hypothetical protein [Caldilineaceae bacterium]